MRKNTKIILIGMIIICTLSSITACSKKTKEISDYKKIGKIVMGTNAQFPPFEYYSDEKVIGFDIDIAKKISENLGIELVIEDMNFSSLFDALGTNKIDFILSGMSITDLRKEKVNFSDMYYKSGQVIIIMGNNTQINTKEDLSGKKVGVQTSTTGEDEATKIEGAIISQYNTILAAIMDMKIGNIDAVIYDLEPAKQFAIQNPDIKIIDNLLTQDEYAIAVRKDETELLSLINEIINEMRKNGEYDKLIEKYFS